MNSELPLNEPQERRLTIVLARLEGELRELRADVSHPPESLRLTRYEDPIDPALTKPLVQAIARAQVQVEQMARALDLRAGEHSVLRAHLAALELLNIDLYSSRAKGLRGYGKVAPATAEYLESGLVQLENALGEIIRQLRGGEPNRKNRED
jgi:hypothetical protein